MQANCILEAQKDQSAVDRALELFRSKYGQFIPPLLLSGGPGGRELSKGEQICLEAGSEDEGGAVKIAERLD